ncbi:hypothetical protein SAMN06265377_1507 [Flagellimonas pacifica]|uniref:Type II secretion system protein GspC N-terminal domain-containing protein n=1 Tax=Flagellimonas pacifica TaxID=1247520 RepID=A0A285MV64_9FLAO|nr:hypothetical protein SAMN06265377_1507 [Allomuricauda parva]
MLLGIVLLIWGIIGFKVLSALSPEDETLALAENVNFEPKEVAEKDTFNILVNYRDPFLGTLSLSKKRTKKVVKKREVQFPSVNYTGLITDQNTKNHIFFVTISGNQYLMRVGNTQSDVTLVSGRSNNIKIRYKGILKTIPLQNATQ